MIPFTSTTSELVIGYVGDIFYDLKGLIFILLGIGIAIFILEGIVNPFTNRPK
jgi:hypothetical protein